MKIKVHKEYQGFLKEGNKYLNPFKMVCSNDKNVDLFLWMSSKEIFFQNSAFASLQKI